MTSADIVRELQAATPVAPQTLRLRVQTLEAPMAQPASARLRNPFKGRRWVMLALPTAAAAAVVAGAITGAFDNPQSERDAARTPELTTGAADSAASSLKSAAPQATTELAPVAGSVAPSSPRLERYAAQLTLEVADSDAISKASQDAIAAIRDLGGYIVTAQVANGGTGSASLTLRVPHDKAQEAFVRLQSARQGHPAERADRRPPGDRRPARQGDRPAASTARGGRGATRRRPSSTRSSGRSSRRGATCSRASSPQPAAVGPRRRTRPQPRRSSSSCGLPTPSQVVPVTKGPFDRSLDRVVEILALEAVIVATAAAVLLPFALLGGAIWFGRRGLRRRMEHDLLGA